MHPVAAFQYRVTPDAVYYSDLRTDEHRIDTDGNPIEDEDETVPVYAVVVHPPDTTSYVANVYRSRETAEMVAEQQEAENAPGTTCAVKEYKVVW